jgi:Domain of unknown function (DUF1816)
LKLQWKSFLTAASKQFVLNLSYIGVLEVTLSTKHNHNHQISQLAWWLEIGTFNPICIYFFGPFEDKAEAESHKAGFFQDLEGENARILYSNVKFCQPRQLTIDGNELTINDLKLSLNSFLTDLIER